MSLLQRAGALMLSFEITLKAGQGNSYATLLLGHSRFPQGWWFVGSTPIPLLERFLVTLPFLLHEVAYLSQLGLDLVLVFYCLLVALPLQDRE